MIQCDRCEEWSDDIYTDDGLPYCCEQCYVELRRVEAESEAMIERILCEWEEFYHNFYGGVNDENKTADT